MHRLIRAFLPLLLFAATASGTPIFFENFDSLSGSYGTGAALGQFLVASGDVEVVGPGTPWPQVIFCPAPVSGRCVDLNGTSLGELQASIALDAGPHVLSFVLVGSGRGPVSQTRVRLGAYIDETIVLATAEGGLYSYAFDVVTPETALLSFASEPIAGGHSMQGAQLDTVSLDTVVPEPATLGLLPVAIGALWVLRRRSRTIPERSARSSVRHRV